MVNQIHQEPFMNQLKRPHLPSVTIGISAVLAIMVSFIPHLVCTASSDPIVLPKLVAIWSITTITIILYAPAIIKYFEGKPGAPFAVKMAILFLLMITVTMPFSINIARSIYGTATRLESYKALAFYVILMVMAAYFYQYQQWHVKLYLASACIMALHAALIRYEYILFGIDASTTKELSLMFTGCGNQNFLGSYMTLALPIAVIYWLRHGGKLGWVPAGLVYFGLLCSNTRGSWIGSCLMFIAILVIYWKNPLQRRRLVGICGVFMALTGVYFFTYTGFRQRFETFSSVDARSFIYFITWGLIQQRPMTGWGIETLDIAILENVDSKIIVDYFGFYAIIDKAHSELIHIAYCSGIPAALAYLSMQLSVMAQGVRHFTREAQWSPLLFSVTGYMIAAFWNISNVNVAPIFWIFCGVLVAMVKAEDTGLLSASI